MQGRYEYIILAFVALGLATFFLIGKVMVPTERAPLPEALKDYSRLAPEPLEIQFSDAEWRATKPALPTFAALEVAAPERVSLPAVQLEAGEAEPLPDESPELPSYVPVAHESLDLASLNAGTFSQLNWRAGETLYGASIPTPILVARGEAEGPTLLFEPAP